MFSFGRYLFIHGYSPNSAQQGRAPLFDIEPARRTCKNLVLCPGTVPIPLRAQIEIRVCRPQTGRQSGKKFDTVAAYSSDIGLSSKNLLFATLKNAPCLQASLLSSDPSGSGLTIGPNAWLKRKVINCPSSTFPFHFLFQLHLRPQHRGVHLVTEEILAGLPELAQFQVRLALSSSHFAFKSFVVVFRK